MIRRVTETHEVERHYCDGCGVRLPNGTEGRVMVTVAAVSGNGLTEYATRRYECPGEWCHDCARKLMSQFSDMTSLYAVPLPKRVGSYPQEYQPDPVPGCEGWDEALEECRKLMQDR